MVEQGTEKIDLMPVNIQGNLFAETDKEPLKYMPGERMFMEINFRKDKTKDIGFLKPNSKIIKKKRHKDKSKLFKLDKHLWDSAMQLPKLRRSGKDLRKKNRIATHDAQVSGGHNSHNGDTKNETHRTSPHNQPKPLEYTFDILCLTDNVPSATIVKEPEDNYGLEGNRFLTQEAVPVANKCETNTFHLGDLIVLESPNPSKPKVCSFDGPLSDAQRNMHDTMAKAIKPSAKLLSLNLLLGTPVFPSSTRIEPCQEHVPETPKQMVGLFDGKHAEPSIVKLEKVSDPALQLVIDSAGPECSKKSAEESMNIKAYKDVGILGCVNELESPASTAVLQDKNVCVSADENSGSEYDDQYQLINSELLENVFNPDCHDDKATPSAFFGSPGVNSPTSAKIEEQQILISQQTHQVLVDRLTKDPFPKAVRDIAKVQVRRRAFSCSDALIASNLCILPNIHDSGCQPEVEKAEVVNGEGPCSTHSGLFILSQRMSVPIEDLDHSITMPLDTIINGDHSKRFSCFDGMALTGLPSRPNSPGKAIADIAIHDCKDFVSGMPTTIGDRAIGAKGERGNTLPVDVTEVKYSAESNRVVPEVCKCEPYNIEDSKPSSGLALITSGEFSPTQQSRTSPSTSNCSGQVGGIGLNRSPEPPSSDLDVSLHSSLKPEQETSVGSVETLGMLLTKSSVIGDYNDISPPNILDQSPVPASFDVKELRESLDPVKITNFGKFEAKIHEAQDSMLALQETSIILDTESASPELLSFNTEDPNRDRHLEMHGDHAPINISSQAEERKNCREILYTGSELIITPIEDSATPTGVGSRSVGPYNESSCGDQTCVTPLNQLVLPPGKKFRRSLAIIRNLNEHPSARARRGRHYEISVEEIIKLQGNNAEATTPVQTLCKRLSTRRSSWMRQITPPPGRRSTFIWSPKITDRGTLYETPYPRKSKCSTPLHQNLADRMSLRVSPMLGLRKSVRSPYNQNCFPTSPVQYTITDLILTICKQAEPCTFSDILSEESYQGGCKVGEGVFGEVFTINRDGQNTVLKIVPIEGQQLVNGEKQKTYQEVLSELVIAKVLDEMRYEGSDESNITSGFAELIATSLVQDCYPEALLQFWEEFDQKVGSDNDNPKMFEEDQLFIVMEQGHGGKDLESYTFSSAKQSLSIFKQIAFSLAVAEMSVEFEHRDLHWGNVLVSKTTEKHIHYTLNGSQYSVASNGVKCTIIDYTLSRIKYINEFPIYNDIGKDPEMFIATGDYQFDIYRFMKKDVEDDWSRFVPKTNARWLHYLLDKMLKKVKYQRKTAKVHKDSFKALEEIGTWIEDCASALSVATRLAELKN